MKKLIILTSLIFTQTLMYSQKLTLIDLVSDIYLSVAKMNDKLTNKNWELNNVAKGDAQHYSASIWEFKDATGYKVAYLYFYQSPDITKEKNYLVYQFADKKLFLALKKEVATTYKGLGSLLENGEIGEYYNSDANKSMMKFATVKVDGATTYVIESYNNMSTKALKELTKLMKKE